MLYVHLRFRNSIETHLHKILLHKSLTSLGRVVPCLGFVSVNNMVLFTIGDHYYHYG
jgi:hypothetical protein